MQNITDTPILNGGTGMDVHGSGRKLGKVDRGREACNECRRHKIRCHPHPDDPQHLFPCSRCDRMHLTCEFAKHNRGRKRKRPAPLLSDSNTGEASEHNAKGKSKSEGRVSRPGYNNSGPVTLPPPHILGDPRFPFISADADQPLTSPTTSRSELGYQHAQQISLRRMVGEQSSGDDDDDDDDISGSDKDGVEEAEQEFHQSTNKRKAKVVLRGPELVDDPVRAGFVDEHEARWLFHLFLTHFNTALPMLDPSIHTHDYVRETSSFLYTAILCVTSRYLSLLTPANSSNPTISPESAQSVHQQILVLARDHLTWAYAEATVNIDVVRAMVVLALHKEPDDDKAGYHVDRAVLMGKELNLGRMPPREELAKMSEGDLKCLRSRQRVWLCLFFVNSIFNMQFRLPMLILQTDPLVATAHHWLKRSRPDTLLRDTQLVCSVELRRKFLHYRELLVGPAPDEIVYRSALSLALLTRTMNQDWDVSCEAWIRDIIDAGGTSSHISKPRIWTASLRLNLNLLIMNQTLRLSPHERIDGGAPSSISAFHHCLNAATTVLLRLEALDKTQLTFASDTFLHFALYAATLLATLSRGQHPHNFEPTEVEYCHRLIVKTADALDAASSYPSDSPILHAYYLRRLCQLMPKPTSSTQPTSAPLPASTATVPAIDPALQNVQASLPDLNPNSATGTLGVELDMLFADFPWIYPDAANINTGMTNHWDIAQTIPQAHPVTNLPYGVGMADNLGMGLGLGGPIGSGMSVVNSNHMSGMSNIGFGHVV